MRVRSILLSHMVAWQALATTCMSYEPVKACQIYHSSDVIFRGRMIDHNSNNANGRRSGSPLCRFRVVEAFKGLPKGITEVFISVMGSEPGFLLDSDRLIYANSFWQAATVGTFYSPGAGARPIPAAWKGKERAPVYSVGFCDPLKEATEGDDDLTYLRSAGRIRPQDDGWIEGRTAQNFPGLFPFTDLVAASNAILTFTSPSGDRSAVTTGASGAYRLGPLPPGTYTVCARSPVLGEISFLDPRIYVPPGGCTVANVSFDSKSSILGRVFDSQGKPAPAVSIDLGEVLPSGKVRTIPGASATTGKDGTFKIDRAPVGRIVLAANLNHAPTKRMPFDPYYAPGTHRLKSARVFSVKPGKDTTGVLLKLPKPLPFGSLFVDVVWPDGTPALGGARASAEINGSRADSRDAARGRNRVSLRLALNRKYEIRVDWLDSKPRAPFLNVEGLAPQTLDFKRDGQVIQLHLKAPKPK